MSGLSGMTCYFRHLQNILKKAEMEVTKENKREIDKVIHTIVSVEHKDCPATWKEVKKRITENEEGFVLILKEEWNKRI